MNKFMRKLWAKKDSKKGFTLVELIVVLVILGIMAAILIPSMVGWLNKAQERQNVLEARAIMTSTQVFVTEFVAENDALPAATEITAGIGVDGGIQAMSGVDIETITDVTYGGTETVGSGATAATGATIIGMTVEFHPANNTTATVKYQLDNRTWSKID